MDFTTKIVTVIKEAETNKAKLGLEDTIAVMKAFKNVSESQALLEKTLLLLLLIEKKIEHTTKLSKRETQVLGLIGQGFNSKEVSSLLDISKGTVGTHRKNIIKKLDLKGSGKLQKAAFQYTQEQLKESLL
jgi:DNA-binding NarL/FixJ family response regulator